MRDSQAHQGRVGPLVAAMAVATILVGCVSESRRGGSDATAADTDDTGLTQVAVEVEVVEAECDARPDCLAREGETACLRWQCEDHRCVLKPPTEDVQCDDGNACTLGDACVEGVCVPGDGAPECPDDPASQGCNVPICEPEVGCTLAPMPESTLCSNGTGVIPGTCVVGGYQPSDHCDGSGSCVDAAPPDPLTSGAPLLEGDWFLVYTTFGRYRDLTAGRAVVKIETATQTFGLSVVRRAGVIPFASGDGGHICAGADGALDVVLPAWRLSGHHLDGELAVLSDNNSDGIATLIRADLGAATDVDGDYAYFQTTVVFEQALVTTWKGTLDFDRGCLRSGSFLADPARAVAYDFVPGPTGDCFTPAPVEEPGMQRLTTQVQAKSGDTTRYAVSYRGAVMAGGDIVLLVKEAANEIRNLEYGITILVRKSSPFVQSELAGQWRYYLHASPPLQSPRRDAGSVVWDPSGTITGGVLGTLDGTLVTAAGWGLSNLVDNGVSQHVSMEGFDLFQSAVIDPRSRFMVGWVVDAPVDPDRPAALGNTPEGGSMLLMLRP